MKITVGDSIQGVERIRPRVPGPWRPPRAEELQPLRGLELLVVDDDAEQRGTLCDVLCLSGAVVTSVCSGAEALAVLRCWQPHLVVSDLAMPRMTGFELAHQVRRGEEGSSSRLPMLALSAHAADEDRAEALRCGFTAHMAKPADPERVIALIRALAAAHLRGL
ncbi:MAG: response regulator [Myxococcota bacterium]